MQSLRWLKRGEVYRSPERRWQPPDWPVPVSFHRPLHLNIPFGNSSKSDFAEEAELTVIMKVIAIYFLGWRSNFPFARTDSTPKCCKQSTFHHSSLLLSKFVLFFFLCVCGVVPVNLCGKYCSMKCFFFVASWVTETP